MADVSQDSAPQVGERLAEGGELWLPKGLLDTIDVPEYGSSLNMTLTLERRDRVPSEGLKHREKVVFK